MSVDLRPPHTDAAIIRCDSCKRVLNVHPGSYQHQVRAVAAKAGWSSRPRRGRMPEDLCPSCA